MSDQVSYAEWDIGKKTIDLAAIQSADFIIHLTGAGVVEKRWTPSYKKEIRESRIQSSELLVHTLKNHTHHVQAIIAASAIGWYGADRKPRRPFIETDPPSEDFLGQTCIDWEKSIGSASELGIRVCSVRTGIVLSNEGGALKEFRKPIKFGIASILGDGKQVISWIHIEDLCRMFIFAMENNLVSGSYNAVSNLPVTNKDLTIKLAESIKGKFYIPLHVPGLLLKLIMGESSIELLKSTTVDNSKIKAAGFTFIYPSVDAAISDLAGKKFKGLSG
jgi:uncharacterized protein (TIGR01777 family)